MSILTNERYSISYWGCSQVKQGVKRKVEGALPGSVVDSLFTPGDSKAARIPTRRESGRQIKKPARSSDDGLPYSSHSGPPSVSGKEKLSESLKFCNEILKELFSKKHSVS